ncbi:LysR family transcriptional regulator [Paenibacillus eucommiae]|uniref:LysR family transcriptional activator of glutamate synthase operon n=1 Tax=Paenibacillus eucommiae TaxID=1355755 RepID=A0ABS4IYZ7_9BACL|nr:LysR family transcriptional regulator [Paenibacillus eucommiae]MBP1992275.1 LysR family transcriptional activator of glutamate synthase operon [Paenibacillus eucommiae]
MELRQIQYFIEVAKLEHVTEASYLLHVAQSAVSRQIFKLEAELGVDLFIRDGRKVRLTPVGKMFLGHMEQAIQVIEKAQQEIEEFLDPERGTVHIGFPSSLASHMLPMVISAFRDHYPKVQFQLQHGSYRELIDLVGKGTLNLSLIGPVPKHDKQIHGDTLFVERFVALLPASHPLVDQPNLRLNQLRGDMFVLFPEGFVLRDIVIDACEAQGFEPKISFEGDDIDTIKGLVAAGLGITLLPEIALNDNIPRSTVKVHIDDPQVTRSVGIITPSNRELPPTEKLFYDFLRNYFATIREFSNG